MAAVLHSLSQALSIPPVTAPVPALCSSGEPEQGTTRLKKQAEQEANSFLPHHFSEWICCPATQMTCSTQVSKNKNAGKQESFFSGLAPELHETALFFESCLILKEQK